MTARIAVLGGGVSGLSSAYILARGLKYKNVPAKIILLDKEKLGGWIQTTDTGKAKFELGPRSIRTAGFVGLHTLKLVHDLDLEDEVISVKNTDISNKNRFLYVNKQLNMLKNGPLDVIKPQPPLTSSFAALYFKNVFKKFPTGAETVYDTFSYKFGEEVTRYHVDAFVRGVFAADIKELSIKAAFPDIWRLFRSREASLPRKPKTNQGLVNLNELSGVKLLDQSKQEKWTQWSLQNGLHGFIDALERGCEGYDIEIVKDVEVTGLTMMEDGKFTISAKFKDDHNAARHEDSLLEFDHVISTLPSFETSKILLNGNSEPTHKQQEILLDIGSKLSEIKFVDVGVVNLEYQGSPEQNLPHVGFGHLVPSCERSNVLGVVYDSCVFPLHDRKDFPSTRLTCMMGGSWFSELFGDPNHVKGQDLEQAALESVAVQLNITSDPTTIVSKINKQCIPTYRVGHTDLVEGVEDQIYDYKIPLSLAGSSYWGVSVNDCICNSRIVADQVTLNMAQLFDPS